MPWRYSPWGRKDSHMTEWLSLSLSMAVNTIPLLPLSRSCLGTSLGVQWLRSYTSDAGGLGSTSGQGVRSHTPQLRSEISTAATKTQFSEINKIYIYIYIFFFFKIMSLILLKYSPGKNTGMGCHSLLQGSSWPRDGTWISCIAGRFFTVWATREALDCSHLLFSKILPTVQTKDKWQSLRKFYHIPNILMNCHFTFF